jgi:hypothetical protein
MLLRVSITLTTKKLRLMEERDVEMEDEGDKVGESDDDDDDDEMDDGDNECNFEIGLVEHTICATAIRRDDLRLPLPFSRHEFGL